MIPRYDITPRIRVDYETLRVPTPYEVLNGFAPVRDYEPLVTVTWAEARDCVEAEARWLAVASGEASQEEFDRVLDSAPEEESGPDDFDWLFRYLDLGVAGLSLVLSASGFVTYYSCRTHSGNKAARVPQVGMAAEAARARILAEYASDAGCGLETHEADLLSLYAPSVVELHELAKLLLDHEKQFQRLPAPPWFDRVSEILSSDDREEFGWGHEEIT